MLKLMFSKNSFTDTLLTSSIGCIVTDDERRDYMAELKTAAIQKNSNNSEMELVCACTKLVGAPHLVCDAQTAIIF